MSVSIVLLSNLPSRRSHSLAHRSHQGPSFRSRQQQPRRVGLALSSVTDIRRCVGVTISPVFMLTFTLDQQIVCSRLLVFSLHANALTMGSRSRYHVIPVCQLMSEGTIESIWADFCTKAFFRSVIDKFSARVSSSCNSPLPYRPKCPPHIHTISAVLKLYSFSSRSVFLPFLLPPLCSHSPIAPLSFFLFFLLVPRWSCVFRALCMQFVYAPNDLSADPGHSSYVPRSYHSRSRHFQTICCSIVCLRDVAQTFVQVSTARNSNGWIADDRDLSR